MEQQIENSISFLLKLENTPRINYDKNTPPTYNNEPPFWIGTGPLNDIEYIKKKGIVCVGFSNLIRRLNNLEIPGMITGKKLDYWPGGTRAWFEYLDQENRLEKINFSKEYPKGTLLLQNYNSINEGHIAITINSNVNGLLESNIIHNVSSDNFYGTYNHKVKEYSNYHKLTHICLPENWILKN